MTLTLYMSCDPFICTILFGLTESAKIILMKDHDGKIIEAKVSENVFSVTLNSVIFPTRYLYKTIIDDSDRPNRIVQKKGLHVSFRRKRLKARSLK